MNQIPHTISAPASHRPNPGQVMREALDRENVRRQERKDAILSAGSHAFIFVLVVLGTIAIAVTDLTVGG